MHSRHSILINAPLVNVFGVACDIKNWPQVLPFFSESRFISPMPWGGIVKMAASGAGMALKWVCLYRIDTDTRELRFEHLTGRTKGLMAVWSFEETAEGIVVTITQDFSPSWLDPRSWVAGSALTGSLAKRTLAEMKGRVEAGK